MKTYHFNRESPKSKASGRIRVCLNAMVIGLSWIVCILADPAHAQDARPVTSSITLKGVSSGGILTLMKAPALNYPYVSVTTSPGEPAAVIAERLAGELGKRGPESHQLLRSNGMVTLVLGGGPIGAGAPCSGWILGGTERGLNIPAPPCAVSASYDRATERVNVRWENPKGGYDSVVVVYYSVPLAALPGDCTQYVHQRNTRAIDAGFSSKDIPIFVLGYKDGVPSNGAGVRIRDETGLESLLNVPFTDNVAPGFERWAHNTPADGILCNQGNLSGVKPGADMQHLRGKGFYQTVTARGPSRGGVQRRFIGLNSGHAYRVTAQLSILEATNGQWAFSFHAAANPPGQTRLNEAQLAGLAELPTGSAGPTAGQIARYEPLSAKKGEWQTRSSGESASDNLAKDIMIPEGSDSLTVWFRLAGTGDAETTIGIDSVSIEDLGNEEHAH